jgi:hypothetical protein
MKLVAKLEEHRIATGDYASRRGDPFGAFKLQGPCGAELVIIAADAGRPETQGWEHVSVSVRHRIPNWTEMSFVKDLFWAPLDCVVQYHVPKSEHINLHPNVLHLWHCATTEFPRPPSILV